MDVLVRQLQHLGLLTSTAAGLAAIPMAGVGGWLILIGLDVVSSDTDAWTTPIGVIFLLVAATLALIAWFGTTFIWRRLSVSSVKAGAGLIASYASGSALAVASWSACYDHDDWLEARRAAPAIALATLAAVAVAIGRPRELLPGIAVGAGAVAVVVFWWLVGNTAAVGCLWYQTPMPRSPPSPTSTSIAVRRGPTTVPLSVPPTTVGPQTTRRGPGSRTP